MSSLHSAYAASLYSQSAGSGTVHFRVVDEQCLFCLDACLFQHAAKYSLTRFYQVHLIREKYIFEIIVCSHILIREQFVVAVSPMYLVRVTQQISMIVIVQVDEFLNPFLRDFLDHRVPGVTYLFVSGITPGFKAHLIAEFRHAYCADFQFMKNILLFALIHIVRHVGYTDGLERVHAALSVKVDNDSAEVENNILYPFFQCLYFLFLFALNLFIPLHNSPIHKTNEVEMVIIAHSFNDRCSVRNIPSPNSTISH